MHSGNVVIDINDIAVSDDKVFRWKLGPNGMPPCFFEIVVASFVFLTNRYVVPSLEAWKVPVVVLTQKW